MAYKTEELIQKTSMAVILGELVFRKEITPMKGFQGHRYTQKIF